MIRNERELEAAVVRLAELDAEIEGLEAGRPGTGPWGVTVAEFEEQAEDLRAKVARYEQLREGKITHLGRDDVRTFGESLVEARVVRGMTEDELAEVVDVSSNEMKRHEREGYRNAPFRLVSEVVETLTEKATLRLRLPTPERAGPWSVLEEISNGRPVKMVGHGTLTLQSDQPGTSDAPPGGPGLVDVNVLYDPAEGGDLSVRLGLKGRDSAGEEILSWQPGDAQERTIPRYDFSGEVDDPGGLVGAKMAPVYVDFRNHLGGLGLLLDSAHGLSAGPGLGSAPERLRALVPNLYADAEGEAAGLRFRLRPIGEVQPDIVLPEQVGKILPGSYLELERVGEEAVDLEEAAEAFGWFMSFYAGRAVHPIAWEAETPDGPYWTIQSLRRPSPLPNQFSRTCLPLNVLGLFLEQAWGNWVGFDAGRRRHLQGVVNLYESILTIPYPILGVALTAMYLERFRDRVLGPRNSSSSVAARRRVCPRSLGMPS